MTWKQLKERVEAQIKKDGRTEDIPIDFIEITHPVFFLDPSEKLRPYEVGVSCRLNQLVIYQ